MNHLTNLYKHKCEQLQERLNNLTKMLNEGTGTPWWRGRPRIHGIPDFDLPNYPDGSPRVYGRNISPTNIPNIPQAWTDLLNLGNARTPSQMQELIQHLRTDTLFMTWWEQNYGILKNVGDVYQRLIHGTVWRWDNTLGAWQPITKPGTQTHFGQIGPGGALITPDVNPSISNADIPPFPWQPHNRPKPPPPPPDTTGPGWNSGTNN